MVSGKFADIFKLISKNEEIAEAWQKDQIMQNFLNIVTRRTVIIGEVLCQFPVKCYGGLFKDRIRDDNKLSKEQSVTCFLK